MPWWLSGKGLSFEADAITCSKPDSTEDPSYFTWLHAKSYVEAKRHPLRGVKYEGVYYQSHSITCLISTRSTVLDTLLCFFNLKSEEEDYADLHLGQGPKSPLT
ncbi:hypothetical protein AVEN_35370-1 [Araneus ventricosus]|uniref:Uncharacterized protein n=1 Tax=Araneus ventricosus TaxID=182803 RepID=A0A4Y2LZI1_ARAVE|nr:hypothetical protein AVEN_35370-1 [Araneus ventricosus]